MFGSLAKKIFGSVNDRRLKSYRPKVAAINAMEAELEALSDEQLRARTEDFKAQLAAGKTLDDILVPAFATVREAAKRTLGQRHFDVQLIGGMVLHEGSIAEMRTGEGKTLVATLPVYLNALAGKGVHVVTVNDYLARRDSEWMGQIYRFLGLSVGVIVHGLDDVERAEAYAADITYGTNNEYGFDYLRDNMKYEMAQMVQRGHNFAIVDEVDSILVDEARTPLIISGPLDDRSELYNAIDVVIPRLNKSDYELDEKQRSVALTEDGTEKIEALLREIGLLKEGDLYDAQNATLVHHMNQALRAHTLFQRDKDYIVRNGEVVIIDEFTGRMMQGRRYSEGLHQALEAKEKVQVQPENQTLASITFQNYFRLYDKLAGMTGTAATEADEFLEIYNLEVVEIPTNRPVSRIDDDDEVYRTMDERYQAVIRDIEESSAKGQPILVGTTSIEKSELLAELLIKDGYTLIDFENPQALEPLYRDARAGRGTKHFAVLNARFHEQEAFIVAQAGVPGAITIATNMAGRGTDIQLGGNAKMRVERELVGIEGEERARREKEILEEVASFKEKALAAGGLYVLGTERHESRRIDNQLRGRSGRQGDPGESRFYLSLQDDLMKRFRAGAVEAVMDRFNIPEDVPIESKMVTRQIRSAQTQIEGQNAEIRKNVLKYDEVLNKQRQVIYAERKRVLDGEDMHDQAQHMIDDVIEDYVRAATSDGYAEDWDLDQLWVSIKRLYPIGVTIDDLVEESGGERTTLDQEYLIEELKKDAQAAYAAREEELGEEAVRELERQVLLAVIDRKWREHLYEMDYLQEGISLRAYAQRDPVVEYQREGFDMFNQMMEGIKEEAVGFLFNLEVQVEEAPTVTVDPSQAVPLPASSSSDESRVEVRAKGLGGPRRPANLQYTAPAIDGEAGDGSPVIQQQAAPAL
ncbi:MAG: preprotein translocase subunit SecA, partial [Microvirga sp.]